MAGGIVAVLTAVPDDDRAHVVVEEAVSAHALQTELVPRLGQLRLVVRPQPQRRVPGAEDPLPRVRQGRRCAAEVDANRRIERCAACRVQVAAGLGHGAARDALRADLALWAACRGAELVAACILGGGAGLEPAGARRVLGGVAEDGEVAAGGGLAEIAAALPREVDASVRRGGVRPLPARARVREAAVSQGAWLGKAGRKAGGRWAGGGPRGEGARPPGVRRRT